MSKNKLNILTIQKTSCIIIYENKNQFLDVDRYVHAINVKVEFVEGKGKVPLDNIAKRAETYKPREQGTYKMIKEYIEAIKDALKHIEVI